MKEELIRDNSTYNADRQALKKLLDYAQSSLAVAEHSTADCRRHLHDDFVVNFADYAGLLYKNQLEAGYYRRLAEVITDENNGVADVRGYLQRRKRSAQDLLSEPRTYSRAVSLASILEHTWRLEFCRFDYRESGRLLQKYLNVNPE